jgi:hypothetical protein
VTEPFSAKGFAPTATSILCDRNADIVDQQDIY